jgi:hypothetical protein
MTCQSLPVKSSGQRQVGKWSEAGLVAYQRGRVFAYEVGKRYRSDDQSDQERVHKSIPLQNRTGQVLSIELNDFAMKGDVTGAGKSTDDANEAEDDQLLWIKRQVGTEISAEQRGNRFWRLRKAKEVMVIFKSKLKSNPIGKVKSKVKFN